MKNLMAKETLLAFPDFNLPFHIHTDASKVQLGACISQENKPLAFYSRKLNPAQRNYTVQEIELLSIVETLKEFRNILLGHEIIIHTDHQNLVHKNLTTERVLRWRLYMEEYGPTINYIKGESNVVADALSRLPYVENKNEDSLENFYAIFESFGKELKEDHRKTSNPDSQYRKTGNPIGRNRTTSNTTGHYRTTSNNTCYTYKFNTRKNYWFM